MAKNGKKSGHNNRKHQNWIKIPIGTFRLDTILRMLRDSGKDGNWSYRARAEFLEIPPHKLSQYEQGVLPLSLMDKTRIAHLLSLRLALPDARAA